MSGLYYCKKCFSYYQLSDEHDKAIGDGCDKDGVFYGVVRCQCGSEHVAGGDQFRDDDGQLCISIFGWDAQEKDRDFPRFDAVMLTLCDDDDPEKVAGTIHGNSLYHSEKSRSISLKPGKPDYIPRNLPINCANDDLHGIRWWIVGNYHGLGSGVLEYCTSMYDAQILFNQMNHFIQDGDKIEISHSMIGFGLDKIDCGDSIIIIRKDGDIMGIFNDYFRIVEVVGIVSKCGDINLIIQYHHFDGNFRYVAVREVVDKSRVVRVLRMSNKRTMTNYRRTRRKVRYHHINS